MATEGHVLVLTTAIDTASDVVEECLTSRGASVRRVNTESFPYDQGGTLAAGHDALSLSWLADVGAIWYRRIRSPSRPDGMEPDVHDYCVREARTFLQGSILASPAPKMSDPARVWAAEHKPYQLRIARELGIPIPETVITNEPKRIRDHFRASSGNMIVKPLRSGYVEISGEPSAIFTNRVLEEHLDEISTAVLCPAIYQRLIPKRCDLRVTFVGGQLFAAEIDSQSDPAASVDWRRTENPALPHRATDLPPQLSSAVHRLMKALDLQFGALDFIVTPEGDYYFLEVNPNGQWLWLDDILNFGISDTIADWLIDRATGH